MTLVRTNIIANYAGQAWMALVAIIFVPTYAASLGIEAFGLVGVMLSIQAMSLLLDMGLGGVVNRELARRCALAGAGESMRGLVKTLEWVIWPMATVIAILVTTSAPWMAKHWLHPHSLSLEEATHAIRIMGIAVALQWPAAFYTNALSGLERQPAANIVNAVFATLRNGGSAAVLLFIDPSIGAFMTWQAIIGIGHSLVAAVMVWRSLPHGTARFQRHELQASRAFAGGLLGITALSMLVTQLDRLLLSTLRPLEDVGYFTLALTVAAGLGRLVQPMFNAVYPRFSRLVATNDTEAQRRLYHLASQYLSVIVASASAVLIAFPRTTLLLWTGDATTADIVAMPMVLLIGGSFLNGLMNLPYALQLAHGWTGLAMGMNVLALCVCLPLGLNLVSTHGITGAAWLWLVTNIILSLVGLPLMHRRILPGDLASWLRESIVPPILTATCAAAACAWLMPGLKRDLAGLGWLILASGITLGLAAMSVKEPRRRVIQLLGHAFSRVT